MSDSTPEVCDVQGCCKRRCCWMIPLVVLVVLAFMLFSTFVRRASQNEIAGPPLLKADGKQLKSTTISSYLEAPIESGKNVLWCSTFQLVWNEGCRYAGGDIHLKDEPPIVAQLNKKDGSSSDVDPSSCLVMSGLVQNGIVGKIQAELERKFQGQADPDLLRKIEPDLPVEGWLAYSYLFRSLPFKCAFKRLPEPLMFGSARVASFGFRELRFDSHDWLNNQRIAEQVAILDYENDDNFIVALKPEDANEQIVLAKIAPAETLLKTVEKVRSRIAASKLDVWRKQLAFRESIVVPILNFDLWQQYEELYHKPIITPGPLEGMPIVLALQSIRFRLDEHGAVLKSEAAMPTVESAEPMQKPRQLLFDKPFLILLERRDAKRPYFALWVDNPELLAPFK
jgi:hypothetical protein